MGDNSSAEGAAGDEAGSQGDIAPSQNESSAKRQSESKPQAELQLPRASANGEKRSSSQSDAKRRGSSARMEKDDAVVTGAGSAEEAAEGTLSPEALEERLSGRGSAADAPADVSGSTGDNAILPDATGQVGSNEVEAAETSNEGERVGSAVSNEEEACAPTSGAPAESLPEESTSGRRSSLHSREGNVDEGSHDPGAVTKALNLLLGNAEGGAEPPLPTAEVRNSSPEDGEVEGFHDDFLVPQAPPPPEELTAVEQPETANHEEEDRLAAQVQEAREEHERLVLENKSLQKRCAAIATGKGVAERSDGGLLDDGTRFSTGLHQWVSQAEELRRVSAYFDAAIERSKDELQARQDSAVQIRSSYLQLEMEVAREAENSRTGRPLPTKTLRELQERGRQKDEELEGVRLKSIILKNTLARLERALKRKEELADGLHQVDFEQLKIENQAHSEKIKLRDEELAKLRKKVNTTVHILSHQKEKLQHIHRDTEVEGRLLEALEKEVAERRDKLQRVKRQRDAAKVENKNLKLTSGLITQPELLHDVAAQRELAETLKEKVHSLQQRHAMLSTSLSKASTVSGMSTPLGGTPNVETRQAARHSAPEIT